MGQKNHSLALRIHPSGNTRRLPRCFDQIWYSDRYFSKLISFNLSFFKYFNTFLKFFKLPSARYSIQHYQKKTQLYLFFCYPRQSREYKSKIFHISSGLSSLISTKQKTFKKIQSSNIRKHPVLLKNSIKDFLLWQNVIKPSVSSEQKILKSIFSLEKQKYEKLLNSNFTQNYPQSFFIKPKLNFEKNNVLTKEIYQSSILEETLNSINMNLNNQHNFFTTNLLKKLKNLYFPFNIIKKIAINLYIMKGYTICLKKGGGNNQKLILSNQEKSISLDKIINQPQNFLSTNLSIIDHVKYKTHLENYISQQYNFHFKFIPFKVNQEWQDAGYFADEIVFLLERRVPFRQLKSKVLNPLLLNPNIRGLRITCSGRVGGKSKKAQRAKRESVKYGQTSLHVFSSKIDFAVRTAHTPLGSTGIKVWICYN